MNKNEILHVAVEKPMKDKLLKIAAIMDVPISIVIRTALREYLNRK